MVLAEELQTLAIVLAIAQSAQKYRISPPINQLALVEVVEQFGLEQPVLVAGLLSLLELKLLILDLSSASLALEHGEQLARDQILVQALAVFVRKLAPFSLVLSSLMNRIQTRTAKSLVNRQMVINYQFILDYHRRYQRKL